jgi:hypothetical protein
VNATVVHKSPLQEGNRVVTDPILEIPAEAMARLTAAEARLYPMAMTDPDGYQRATMLVGLVAGELRRDCADIATVLDRRSELISRTPRLAEDAGLTLGGLPADVLVDAASALRCRELQAIGAAESVRNRIAQARASGVEWLMDEADPAEVMGGTYRRVETHVPTGSTLAMSIESGGGQAGPTYVIELVTDVDGTPTQSRPQRWTYADRDSWSAAAQDIRSGLSTAS